MKVCIVTPEFPIGLAGRGGVGTYSETLANALTERDVEVHVVLYGDPRPAEVPENVGRVHIHFVDLPWIRYFSSAFPGLWQSWRLASFVRALDQRYRFDVFEMYNDEGVTLFPVVLFRNRTILRMHSSLKQHIIHKGQPFNWKRRFSVWMDLVAVRAARHWVTHSEFHASEMAAEYDLERSDVIVIPHSTRYGSSVSSASGDAVVAYIGSLDRRKGIDIFLEASPAILKSCPSARLLLIGRDTGFSSGKSWKEWFSEVYGHDPRVEFVGSVSDDVLLKLWDSFQILVVPSRYESFGLAVIEGFSHTKAVVTTRAAALPEVAGEAAIVVDPNNSAQLAEAVISLIEDPVKAAKVAALGHERYLQRYTPELFADCITALYSRIAKPTAR